jgi:hypothetical protein
MPSNVRREVITRDYYPDTGGQQGGMKQVALQGKNGDTQLAHVNPIEAELLKRLGGAGTTNPKTGLKQYYTMYDTASPDQRSNITNLQGGQYNADETSYLADLSSGWNSGKYSYEDLTNAYNTLGQQYKPQAKGPGYEEDAFYTAPQGWNAADYLAWTPSVANDPWYSQNPLAHYNIFGKNQGYVIGGNNGGGDGGGGEEGGFNVDFPTNIMPTSKSSGSSYAGLPVNYRNDLLQALMPRLNSAVTNMEPNIDKYTQEALASYQQGLQNALRTNVPASIRNLSNRGILNSTEGQKILGKVYSDAATDASTKGYTTAMQAALLKANMPEVLRSIAELGKYTEGANSSYEEDPTKMYSIMANMLMGQF